MRSIRLDDVGASSKRFEYHAPKPWQNIYPLNHRRLFGLMAPYRELHAHELETIFHTVALAQRVLCVGVTAYWVSRRGSLMAFNRKYPGQAAVIAMYARRGVVEVAAHGATHCVVGQHRPRWIGSNRYWHRERTPWRDEAKRSIESWLELPILRFIEPGEIARDAREVVFHDREFVCDWPAAMHRLQKALR